MENWNWEADSSKRSMQGIAKKLKNWEEFFAKKLSNLDKQEIKNWLCNNRWILRLCVSHVVAQIRDLQNKVNSLSDAREFYDPESGSSSGATHAPDQTSTILSSRTLLRCDSGLPQNTQNCAGIMGNVFERPPAQVGLSSIIFHNSKNLASSSQVLRPDISETAWREMKRESLTTPTQSPQFQSRSGILDRASGTYSHVGMMAYSRFSNLGNASRKFSRLYGISKLESQLQDWKVCSKSADPHLTMHWIQEVEVAKSIDEFVTSRSFTGQPNFLDFDMFDAMIASALKKLINTQSTFRKRVSVEKQRAQNSDRFSRGRQIAYMICEYFRATGACDTVQGVADLVSMILQNDDVQDVDERWGVMHYFQWVKCLQMRSCKNCTSQNHRMLFIFRLWWPCMIKKLLENNGTPNYQQLKTAVKLHIDQMMRNRNFRARNDAVEECFQWKAHGHCSKGDSCSFSHDPQASGIKGKTDWRWGTKILTGIRQ